MAAPDGTKLRRVLDDILTSATAALSDPPERRYVSAGEPAADCAQLTVHCTSIRTVGLPQPTDTPGPRPQPKVKVATIAVTLWLPTCTSAKPEVPALAADGQTFAEATWELYAGLAWRAATGTLLPSFAAAPALTTATDVTAAAADSNDGGLAGWVVTIELAL